jgi:hypothetical protein
MAVSEPLKLIELPLITPAMLEEMVPDGEPDKIVPAKAVPHDDSSQFSAAPFELVPVHVPERAVPD